MDMKTLKLAFIAALLALGAFGQTGPGVIMGGLSSSAPAPAPAPAGPSISITVTDAQGQAFTAKVYGVPAGAAMEILAQWMATQSRPDGSPKYANVADVIRQHSIELVRSLIAQGYMSSETKAEVERVRAAQQAIEDRRRQLIDAALAQR
jgi:hypothetical protein